LETRDRRKSWFEGTNSSAATGSGTFTQTSGNHTVADTLSLGDVAGSHGAYNLSGGLLTAGRVNRGPAFLTLSQKNLPASCRISSKCLF
jgi:hypothetical protein